MGQRLNTGETNNFYFGIQCISMLWAFNTPLSFHKPSLNSVDDREYFCFSQVGDDIPIVIP